MKYIDTERLRKEVKRLEKAAHKSALGCADSETRKFHEGKDFAYQSVSILIDALQQEQPEVDLEKELDRYLRGEFQQTMVSSARDGFIAGAEWQKEQMLKDAVDGVVEDWNPEPHPEITIPLNPEEFTAGDKVKLIIVKED